MHRYEPLTPEEEAQHRSDVEDDGPDDPAADMVGRLLATVDAARVGRGEGVARALYQVMSRQYGDRYKDVYPSTEWDELGPGAAQAWREDADAIVRALTWSAESDVEAAAKKLVAEMVRQDMEFDDELDPFTRALHGLGMAVDPEKFKPIPTPIEEAAARWHLDPARLTDLVLGPHDQDGWPVDRETGELVTLTEGEHWAVQEVADAEATNLEKEADRV